MKDLLAVITPISGDAPGCATNYALALAGVSGAHLSALIVEFEPDSTASPVGNMQATRSVSATERLTRTTELIQAAAKLANVPCSLLPKGHSRSLRDVLIDNAQVRDLVIIDVQGPLRHPAVRPIVEGRALVAWDATRSAVRALHDALPLLIRAREVVVMSVTDDKEFQATHSGEDICRYLGRWDIHSRFEPVKRGSQNVGDILLDGAARIKADLLVMGGFGHPREREFVFGSATRDVFQSNLEVAVLLSH
jgi:nucleotide-binding universal stress UspA family protein